MHKYNGREIGKQYISQLKILLQKQFKKLELYALYIPTTE
jgi:hypothetical protein